MLVRLQLRVPTAVWRSPAILASFGRKRTLVQIQPSLPMDTYEKEYYIVQSRDSELYYDENTDDFDEPHHRRATSFMTIGYLEGHFRGTIFEDFDYRIIRVYELVTLQRMGV